MRLNWELLYNDNSDFFPRMLSFEQKDNSRFRYGVNERLEHCLFFYFNPNPANSVIEPVKLANISLHEIVAGGKPALVLTLLNSNLKNLFDDLIISMVNHYISISAVSKKDIIALCNEWFELFEPSYNSLSTGDLQGIFAEVYFLQFLLQNSGSDVNMILQSWQGPYGTGHDFELGNNLFEVKSRKQGFSTVRISSEYQMDYLSGQNLFLVVCDFSEENGDGTSISQLILDTVSAIRTHSGANINLFWTALGRLKLGYSNLDDYNKILFSLTSANAYNCCDPVFPSIRRSGIPDSIRKVKYELALDSLPSLKLSELKPLL